MAWSKGSSTGDILINTAKSPIMTMCAGSHQGRRPVRYDFDFRRGDDSLHDALTAALCNRVLLISCELWEDVGNVQTCSWEAGARISFFLWRQLSTQALWVMDWDSPSKSSPI